MKNIVSVDESWGLVLKPEYKERVVSVNGEVGAEVAYEDIVHKVINVNKDTGTYETEAMDMDSYYSERSKYTSISDNSLLNTEESSDTYVLDTDMRIASPKTEAFGNGVFFSWGTIFVKDAYEMTQYLRRPQISIVRIEGELVLSK